MSYMVNVSRHGRHQLRTEFGELGVVERATIRRLQTAFPEGEGFRIEILKWTTTGESFLPELERFDLGAPLPGVTDRYAVYVREGEYTVVRTDGVAVLSYDHTPKKRTLPYHVSRAGLSYKDTDLDALYKTAKAITDQL